MSNSTRVLLVIIVIGIIFGGYYMFVYKSLENNEVVLNSEVNRLQGEYNRLTEELRKKDEYLDGIEVATDRLDQLADILPPNLPQENTIAMVHDIETTIGTRVNNFTMTDETIISEFVNPVNPELNEYGIQSVINTTISCNYDQLKNVLDYVNNNKYQMVLRDLTLSSTAETGNIIVSINLTTYGLRFGDREEVQASLGEFDYGKDSVFEPFEEYAELFELSDSYQSTEDDLADFIIVLDPMQSDRSTTTIGRAGDNTRSTYIYDDNSGIAEGEIHFYQIDDYYYYKYKLEFESYPIDYSQGYMFEPGEELEIQIFSAERVDSEDISGININIVNDTDMVVNLIYYSEDFGNPRFNYTSQGAVEVH